MQRLCGQRPRRAQSRGCQCRSYNRGRNAGHVYAAIPPSVTHLHNANIHSDTHMCRHAHTHTQSMQQPPTHTHTHLLISSRALCLLAASCSASIWACCSACRLAVACSRRSKGEGRGGGGAGEERRQTSHHNQVHKQNCTISYK